MNPEEDISFKSIEDSDLPIILGWVNLPHVQEGYSRGISSFEDVVIDYGPSILQSERIDGFIILFQKKYIGYIQKYLLNPNDYEMDCKNAAGLDIFIGDPEYLSKKLGKYILYKFLYEIIFYNLNIDKCIINPRPDNVRAIKTYEKLGFVHVKTMERQDASPEYIMQLNKANLIRQ